MKMEGKLTATDLKFAIVVSRFNEFITSKLLEGARDCFTRHGGDEDKIDVVWVPGAFELGLAAQTLLSEKSYDGVICLGSVIRGDTSHYDLVCNEAAKACHEVMMKFNTPVGFGVITTENLEQAIERAGSKAGNKGAEACLATIEMANLIKQIKE